MSSVRFPSTRRGGAFRSSGQILSIVFALAALALATPDPDQPSPQRAMCSLLKACQLGYQTSTCTEALSEPVKGSSFDSSYCGWVRGLEKRGIVPDGKITYEMYRYMGTKYHVTYAIADTIPVPLDALNLLLANIPTTAKLINQYRGTSYSAEYPNSPDSLYFKGSNGGNLTGEAWQVWKREDSRERIYYGLGRVKILSWAMRGNVIIELKAWPDAADPRRSLYTMRCTMFPVSGFINSIMNLGIFRSVALGKIEDMLADIRMASEAYSQKKPPVKAIEFTGAERKVLAQFEQIYQDGVKP